jgi:site-specific recombinase XerD
MDCEMKCNGSLINFEVYLKENGYSKNVIPMYLRTVRTFLKTNELFWSSAKDDVELKSNFSDYLKNQPLSSQKSMIQAALHLFYYFITGEQFNKRLNRKDFNLNPLIETEIERFQRYLKEVAGLSNNTIISQCNTIKIFLYSSFQKTEFSPEKITADLVRIHFTHTLGHVLPASKKTLITRIRSYIRFLEFSDGFRADEILKLPMTSPVWRRSGLPKILTGDELNRLYSVYDQTKPTDIRNYAILRSLKDLGLRCSEVAGLTLDDINWRQGTMRIKNTKSHSERLLPLPAMTGQALEAYLLRVRPVTEERILFVRFKNQTGFPMGVSQIRQTVRKAATKAGLENFTGTHMLRHTTAKELINNGTSLKTIADILGHESIETTSIYTKVDIVQLQEVAGIWPEVIK